MKMAVLIGMQPKEYQDIILQTTSVTDKAKYEDIRDNVLNMVSQKVEMLQPKPMDIGSMDRNYIGSRDTEQEEDIDAVGKGKGQAVCYNCGGVGHMARDCPSERKAKGSPKGQQPGKGGDYKGGKKGDPNGYGKGYEQKGKGKGFQGQCWTCGKIGHRSNECRSRGMNEVAEGEEEIGAVEIGGVWNLCQVENENYKAQDRNGWQTKAYKGRDSFGQQNRKYKMQDSSVGLHNKFQGLEREEDGPEVFDAKQAPVPIHAEHYIKKEFPSLHHSGATEKCGCEHIGFKRVNRKDWRRCRRDCIIQEADETGKIWIQPVESEKEMSLRFQVASVKKRLIAVNRTAERERERERQYSVVRREGRRQFHTEQRDRR